MPLVTDTRTRTLRPLGVLPFLPPAALMKQPRNDFGNVGMAPSTALARASGAQADNGHLIPGCCAFWSFFLSWFLYYTSCPSHCLALHFFILLPTKT